MKFLIVTHVVHKKIGNHYFAYGPYVKEMNLWFNHVSEVLVLAPVRIDSAPDPIDLPYKHPQIAFYPVSEFDLLRWESRLSTLFKLPLILAKTFFAMTLADHIHLRCPGNMGLLGAMVQIFFPWKKKTAKYAGNWDPLSNQPASYRLQQKIIANSWFTRNMKVLVYGDWDPSNKNLVSFFTATYAEKEKITSVPRSFSEGVAVRLIFVGSLHPGKNPMISCETVVSLRKRGVDAVLDVFGEGQERNSLTTYIEQHDMKDFIHLHGNVPSQRLIDAYQKAHFLVFVSESEGWPKAVAEAMFWACLPMTTSVSCVPYMIGHGSRGELVDKNASLIADKIVYFLNSPEEYRRKCEAARDWSRTYTLEKFESEIQHLLIN